MSLNELEQLGDFESVMAMLPPELQADKAERSTIEGFTRKLPRDSIIRKATERILRDQAGDPHTVRWLRDAVVQRSGFRWRERILAAWCLGLTPIPTEARGQILEALGVLANNNLEKDNGGAFWRLQWRTFMIFAPLALITSGPELLNELIVNPFGLLRFPFMNVALSLLVLPFSAMLEKRRLNLARAAAVLSLGRLAAPEATGVVAAAVYDKVGEGSGEVKRAGERALPSVLSALKHEHYGQVRGTSIDHLCRILQDRRDHLVIAVLEAFKKVGPGSAADPVGRLAKRARAGDVRMLAHELVPILESRRRDEQAPRVLLRATGTPGDDNALLRPITSQSESDPDLLLRPLQEESQVVESHLNP